MIWTAVGAIATAIAVIVALIANYRTNKNNEKNRKLQIALLRQQRAQKKLDEMVQNVMRLSKSMNSLDMLNYTSKFTNNTFLVEDMHNLEHLAADGADWAANLTLQMEMLKNRDNALPMLECFKSVWEDFGLWSRCISTLFQCKYQATASDQEELKSLYSEILGEMKNRLMKVNVGYSALVDGFQKIKEEPFAIAQEVVEMFGAEMAREIQLKKKALQEKVVEFIRVEQKRIDDMVE